MKVEERLVVIQALQLADCQNIPVIQTIKQLRDGRKASQAVTLKQFGWDTTGLKNPRTRPNQTNHLRLKRLRPSRYAENYPKKPNYRRTQIRCRACQKDSFEDLMRSRSPSRDWNPRRIRMPFRWNMELLQWDVYES